MTGQRIDQIKRGIFHSPPMLHKSGSQGSHQRIPTRQVTVRPLGSKTGDGAIDGFGVYLLDLIKPYTEPVGNPGPKIFDNHIGFFD